MTRFNMNTFFLLLTTILASPHLSLTAEIEEYMVPDTAVNIDCQNQLVNEVLADISRQSNLEINYDQKLDEKPFITFNDKIEAIDAVIRVLRGKSNVIEFMDGRNTLDIKVFDDNRSLNTTASNNEI